MFQTIWDIYDRNRVLFFKICNEILDGIETDFSPTPRKERDTRWLTNGRSAMEEKGKVEMAQMKRDQLAYGIKCAHNEMAKMYDEFLSAPWIFTAITCPK